jgi:sulfite reductase (NADPH) hemoprotein beta-component
MLRVAVPYGDLSSAQVRVLAKIARDYDRPDARCWPRPRKPRRIASATSRHRAEVGYGHFTTRQNVQFNWIPLDQFRRRDGPAGQREPARHPDQRQLHPQHHQ